MTMIWALAMAAAAPDPVAEATRQASAVEDRFYRAVRQCGVNPPPKPPLRAELTRGIIRYDGTGTVLVYPWEGMDEVTHTTMNALARKSRSGLTGKATYAAIFNEMLVAHELGHWLQKSPANDRWASELNANQIMVAFWREHPSGRPTAVRMAEYLSFTPGPVNPMPPPAGTTDRDWFNANYIALTRSPAYGWYQNTLGKMAWAERPRPRFCTLVRHWLP